MTLEGGDSEGHWEYSLYHSKTPAAESSMQWAISNRVLLSWLEMQDFDAREEETFEALNSNPKEHAPLSRLR